MRRALACLIAAATLAAPAFAEPKVSADMPAIRADMSKDALNVRLERGILGTGRGLEQRKIVVVAKDAAGKVVFESATPVSRRMTYARIAMNPALANANTVNVSVR
jgi:hypothetical protein